MRKVKVGEAARIGFLGFPQTSSKYHKSNKNEAVSRKLGWSAGAWKVKLGLRTGV